MWTNLARGKVLMMMTMLHRSHLNLKLMAKEQK